MLSAAIWQVSVIRLAEASGRTKMVGKEAMMMGTIAGALVVLIKLVAMAQRYGIARA